MDRSSRGTSNRTYYTKAPKTFGKKYKFIKYPEENQNVVNCYAPCEYHPKPEYYDQTAYCPQSPYYENKLHPTAQIHSRPKSNQTPTYTIRSTPISTKPPVPYMTKYPNPMYKPALAQPEIGEQYQQYQRWRQAQQWQQPQQWEWLRVQQQLQQSQQSQQFSQQNSQWQENYQLRDWQLNQLSQQSQQQQRDQYSLQSQQLQLPQQNRQWQHHYQPQQSQQWYQDNQLSPPAQIPTNIQRVNYLQTPQQPSQEPKYFGEENGSEALSNANPNAIKRISPEFKALLQKHEDFASKMKPKSIEF